MNIPVLSALVLLGGGLRGFATGRCKKMLGVANGLSFFSPVFLRIIGSNWSSVKWSCSRVGNDFLNML